MLMLDNKGKGMQNLYQEVEARHLDEELAENGKGLFVHGGNPLYYTSKKGSLDLLSEMHALLKQSENDLGGHHVVFKISRDEKTKRVYMYVDRTPLALIDTTDKTASDVFEESTNARSTHGEFGWRRNLETTMVNEAAEYDALYPDRSAISNEWSCPLRRFAFWTPLPRTTGFNPLAPSPRRTQRLFAGDQKKMTYGTRSHPTQKVASIENLRTVYTSNGFCFCNTFAECQKKESAGTDCTLRDTIKSLYDQEYRRVELLLSDTNICTKQLDWPFTKGITRDGMEVPARHQDKQDCNVIDRLPPFLYAYKSNGKIVKTDKTTLDAGGNQRSLPTT